MLKRFIHNLISWLLAIVVLLSTTSFSIHRHFCGAFLQDISINVPAHKCEMDQNTAKADCETVIKNNCCKDQSQLLQSQDELKTTVFTYNLKFSAILTSGIASPVFKNTLISTKHDDLSHYLPPRVITDIHIRDQAFLI